MSKVSLKKLTAYTLEIDGEHIGDFFERSSWEGFSRLTTGDGELEIIMKADTHLFNMFGCIDTNNGKIVFASPRIHDLINPKQKEAKEASE